MPDTTANRKTRRAQRSTRPAALAGAAMAAVALTAAVVPPAAPAVTKLDVMLAADPVNLGLPAFGIGPIGGLITPLLNAAGMNPLDLAGFISYNFQGGAPSTKGIYDLINGLNYTPVSELSGKTCGSASQDQCRTAFAFSTGYGALGTTDAVHALINGATGTVLDFDPLKPAPTGTGLTQVSGIYLNNILRPNGGFDTRFPMLVEPFGINTIMPAVGQSATNASGASVFNWVTDITWPYNTLADFPVTFSPLAIANSVFAAVPPPALLNLITGSIDDAIAFVGTESAGTVWGSATGGAPFQLPSNAQCPDDCGWGSLGVFALLGPLTGDVPGSGIEGQAIMLDATKPFIPLTTPLYLNSLVANAVLKQINSPYLLGTPLAAILTPALRILINTAYDDVVTPDKLGTVNPNPAAEGKTYAEQGYTAYDRTFAQDPAKPVPFSWSSNPALTQAQIDQAQADAKTAFTDAVAAQKEKPFFGILVPTVTPLPEPVPASTVAAPAEAVAVPAVLDIPAETPAVEVSAPAAGGSSAKAAAADAGDNDNSGGGHTRSARSGRG